MSTKSIEMIARAPSFFENVRESASKGVTWLSENSKTVASSVGETAKNVWASVSSFFVVIAQKLGEYFSMAKDAGIKLYGKAANELKSLTPEMRKGLAAGAVVGTLLTALFCKCCGKKEAAPAPAAGELVNDDASVHSDKA